MTGDDGTARTSLLALLDLVDLVKALAFVGGLELLRELVITNAAGVDNRAGGQNVLISIVINTCLTFLIDNSLQQHHGQHSVRHHQRRRWAGSSSRAPRTYTMSFRIIQGCMLR